MQRIQGKVTESREHRAVHVTSYLFSTHFFKSKPASASRAKHLHNVKDSMHAPSIQSMKFGSYFALDVILREQLLKLEAYNRNTSEQNYNE